MFIDDNLRLTISGSGLTDLEYKVFTALIAFINPKNGGCFPKINTLVEKCDKSEATIRRALRSLIEIGALSRTPRFNKKHNGQMSNSYALNLSADFWNKKQAAYLEQKNKGRHLPSEALYSYNFGARDINNAPATIKDKPHKAKRQEQKSVINNTKPRKKTIKPAEIISMEQIKLDFKYDDLLKACPGNESIIAPLFDVIHRVFNSNEANIIINTHNQKPTAWVIDRIKRLTADNLAQIIERIAVGTEKIKNIGAYLLTCLCGFIDVAPINKQRATNAEAVAPGADHENMTAPTAEPDSINSRDGQSTTAARSNTLAYYQRRQQPTALRAMIEHVNRTENVIDLDAMLSADPYRFRRPRTAPTV